MQEHKKLKVTSYISLQTPEKQLRIRFKPMPVTTRDIQYTGFVVVTNLQRRTCVRPLSYPNSSNDASILCTVYCCIYCVAYLSCCDRKVSDANFWTISTHFIAITTLCLKEFVLAEEFPVIQCFKTFIQILFR